MEKTGNITVLEAKSRFKKVDVSIIENENIDCLALGIYTKLIVLGKKWNLNVRGLRKHLGLSDEKVRKALSLLEHEGYIVRTPCRNDKGQLLGWNYAIYPIPVDEYNRSQAGRETKKQPTEEPSTPETEYPENRLLGEPTTRQAEYTETGGDINNRLNVSYKLNESFKKDKDKSLSQKDTEQGCGETLPPSDASSPDVVGSSENTACGVNVNSFKAPLPPTPRMSSDVYVNEFVERMYAMYPAKCPQRNKSTGKSDKDRSRIKKLLKKYTMEQIELVFRYEIEQKYNKSYMSNFSTFLNNFPDPTQIGVHADNGSADNNSNEPALPNGMTREMYEMYIRNGYEIDEYGRIYKDGIMLK